MASRIQYGITARRSQGWFKAVGSVREKMIWPKGDMVWWWVWGPMPSRWVRQRRENHSRALENVAIQVGLGSQW